MLQPCRDARRPSLSALRSTRSEGRRAREVVRRAALPARIAIVAALALAALGQNARAAETRAFIVTTDFSNGGLSAIDVASHAVSSDVATVYRDARERWHDGLLYVINRFGQDNIQVIDPSAGYHTIRQFSTGNGSNPADIVFISRHKAYVTRYELASILIVDPTTGGTLGQISLQGFADADGIPEMDHMIRVGDRVFVSIQRLDRNGGFQPTDTSLVAVINARTDEVIDADPSIPGKQAIKLAVTNPVTRFVYDSASGRLLLGCVGHFGALDGAIEWIDPFAMKDLGPAITEAQLGGDVGAFAWNGPEHSYAIISDASFNSSLVAWKATGQRIEPPVFSPGGFSLPDCALDDRGQLWVCDNAFATPGVYVFSTANDHAIAGPLDTGLPPNQVAFDLADDAATAVPAHAGTLELAGPWPNPSRAAAHLSLSLARATELSVEVMDITGRHVRTLARGLWSAGSHHIEWDLRDDTSHDVSSGIYFVHVKSSEAREIPFVRRVIVVH